MVVNQKGKFNPIINLIDPNLSTVDGLVHLAAEIVIQIKSLEVALHNWDTALRIVIEVNKTFL
ncbi:hypothetical protein, partial [Enterobacter hormaechei]|uniref:hypothetical protein n=1 Tax=Enterobacter hormaechei TaxID=158836 RepID=UPI0023E43DA1